MDMEERSDSDDSGDNLSYTYGTLLHHFETLLEAMPNADTRRQLREAYDTETKRVSEAGLEERSRVKLMRRVLDKTAQRLKYGESSAQRKRKSEPADQPSTSAAMRAGIDQPGPSKRRTDLFADDGCPSIVRRREDVWLMTVDQIEAMTQEELAVFDQVMDILSDADGTETIEVVRRFAEGRDAGQWAHRVIDHMLGEAGYTRRAVAVANRATIERRAELLDHERFSFADYLREFPDPTAVFSDETAAMSAAYRQHAMVYLQNTFHMLTTELLQHMLQAHNHHLYPTVLAIRAALELPRDDALPRHVGRRPPGVEPRAYGYQLVDVHHENPAQRRRMLVAQMMELHHNEMRLAQPPHAQKLQGVDYDGVHVLRDGHHREGRIDWPQRIDERFFRELQFIEHEQAINAYLETERDDFAFAQTNGDLQTCNICASDDIPLMNMANCDGEETTTHGICRPCLRQHALTQINENGKVAGIACVEPGCGNAYAMYSLRLVLPISSIDRLQRRQERHSLMQAGMENIHECPFCDYFVQLDEHHNERTFRCRNPQCQRDSCITCKQAEHTPLSCEAARGNAGIRMRRDIEDRMAEAMIRICPNTQCKTRIMKESGCNSMNCSKCGTHFCYVCNEQITGGYEHFARRPDGRPGCAQNTTYDEEHTAQARQAGERALAEYQAEGDADTATMAQGINVNELVDTPTPGNNFDPGLVMLDFMHQPLDLGPAFVPDNVQAHDRRAVHRRRLGDMREAVEQQRHQQTHQRYMERVQRHMMAARLPNFYGDDHNDTAQTLAAQLHVEPNPTWDPLRRPIAHPTLRLGRQQLTQTMTYMQAQELTVVIDAFQAAAFALRREHRAHPDSLRIGPMMQTRDETQAVYHTMRDRLLASGVRETEIDDRYETIHRQHGAEFDSADIARRGGKKTKVEKEKDAKQKALLAGVTIAVPPKTRSRTTAAKAKVAKERAHVFFEPNTHIFGENLIQLHDVDDDVTGVFDEANDLRVHHRSAAVTRAITRAREQGMEGRHVAQQQQTIDELRRELAVEQERSAQRLREREDMRTRLDQQRIQMNGLRDVETARERMEEELHKMKDKSARLQETARSNQREQLRQVHHAEQRAEQLENELREQRLEADQLREQLARGREKMEKERQKHAQMMQRQAARNVVTLDEQNDGLIVRRQPAIVVAPQPQLAPVYNVQVIINPLPGQAPGTAHVNFVTADGQPLAQSTVTSSSPIVASAMPAAGPSHMLPSPVIVEPLEDSGDDLGDVSAETTPEYLETSEGVMIDIDEE